MIKAGFSLIELMIVVAIVGIIAAIGYPSYQNVVKGSHRGTAQADLMALAAAMERHYNANFTYVGAASETGIPIGFAAHSPASEPATDRRYDLSVVNATATTFQIRARPVTSTSQAGDGDLFFWADGRKAWDQNNNGDIATSEFCWSC